MKLFQFIQSKFAILGISPNQRYPFNRRIQFFFISSWLSNIENGIITSYKPKTFMEFTNSIFITAGTSIVALCYTILVMNLEKLFEFIEFAEEMTDSGEWNLSEIILNLSNRSERCMSKMSARKNCKMQKIKTFSATENGELYRPTNQKIEKWSKIIYNTITIVSPVILISPIVIISLYGYFNGTITADHPLEYPIPWW